MANMLANIATNLSLGVEETIIILVCIQWVVTSPKDRCEEEVKIVFIYEMEKEELCHPLINYLEHRKLRSESRHKIEVQ